MPEPTTDPPGTNTARTPTERPGKDRSLTTGDPTMTHFAFRAGLAHRDTLTSTVLPVRCPEYRQAQATTPPRGQSVLPCPILPLQLGTGCSAWETD